MIRIFFAAECFHFFSCVIIEWKVVATLNLLETTFDLKTPNSKSRKLICIIYLDDQDVLDDPWSEMTRW